MIFGLIVVKLTTNKIIRLFLLLFFSLPFGAMANSATLQHIKLYSGATPFPWLAKLAIEPENFEGWDKEVASKSVNSPIQVSYPKKLHPDALQIQAIDSDSNYSLRLAGLTSITFDAKEGKKPTYLGLSHQNKGTEQEDISMLLTMTDGSKEDFKIKSAKPDSVGFTGFIAEQGISIKQIDIIAPEEANLMIDDVQWGHVVSNIVEEGELKEKASVADTTIVPKTKQLSVCDLKPEVVQLQCDDNQWLFDVKVSGTHGGAAWWCSDDEDEQCASYDEIVSYGYYPKISKKEVSLVFTDQENPSCSKTIQVKLPENCADKCFYRYESGKEEEVCEGKDGNLMTMHRGEASLSIASKEK